MLIVDEAWQLMKYEDSANFLFSLGQAGPQIQPGHHHHHPGRRRLHGFAHGPGHRRQRQHAVPAQAVASAVDVLADVFKLTSEEKKRLSQFPVGQGLFFAGQNHVHIQVVASPTETGLITTNPQQVTRWSSRAGVRPAAGHNRPFQSPVSWCIVRIRTHIHGAIQRSEGA